MARKDLDLSCRYSGVEIASAGAERTPSVVIADRLRNRPDAKLIAFKSGLEIRNRSVGRSALVS
jgi:hypothetical protein